MSPSTSPPASGNNASTQLEEVLRTHPGVRQVAVIISESPSLDQKVIAYLAPDDGYLHGALVTQQIEEQRTREWRTVFDRLQKVPGSSAAFNIDGWHSSYTKRPIPEEEMHEWLDGAVEEILSLHPAEVLEIGCGTGLVLLRIASRSKRYVGVDFSPASLKSLRDQLVTLEASGGSVTLLERQADNFDGLDNHSFDTVIFNSVVQYLPSLEQLTRVFEGALKAAKSPGAIFIGDVRSLPLLDALATSVELFQASPLLSLADLRKRIRRRLNQERELVIAPEYFLAMQRRHQQITRIEIRPKWGNADNEMTRFRYNVTFFIDSQEQKPLEPRWLDWSAEGLTLDAMRDLLQSGGEILAIKGVVNARIEKDMEALARLADLDDFATAGDLRQALSNIPARGIYPDQLRALAKEFDYDVEISWAACRSDGSFDVLFRRLSADKGTFGASVAWPQPDAISEDLSLYVHDPSRIARRRMLIQQLRDFARATLPESMVPTDFIFVKALPLTSDGEIDRNALPAPDRT
jgi:SAM-dependent methyltransferase